MSETSTAEDFLKEVDVQPVKTTFKGRTFYLQTFNAQDRETVYSADVGVRERKARLIHYGVLDEHGEPILSIGQALSMLNKRHPFGEALAGKVIDHNSINDLKDELEGNDS